MDGKKIVGCRLRYFRPPLNRVPYRCIYFVSYVYVRVMSTMISTGTRSRGCVYIDVPFDFLFCLQLPHRLTLAFSRLPLGSLKRVRVVFLLAGLSHRLLKYIDRQDMTYRPTSPHSCHPYPPASPLPVAEHPHCSMCYISEDYRLEWGHHRSLAVRQDLAKRKRSSRG